MSVDEHMRFSGDRVGIRQVDELIGIARGLVADGVVNAEEARFLERWLVANIHVTDQPVISTLYDRVTEILGDNIYSDGEAADLAHLLSNLSGNNFELGEELKASTLPLCTPQPVIKFDGRNFCFTGTFAIGRRRVCEAMTAERGGNVSSVNQKLDYLVIGTYVTDSWKHSSYGLKIERAAELRAKNGAPFIVSEEHWRAALG